MKKINILSVVGLLVFAMSGLSVYAHGTDTGMTGSTGMMRMMDMMHGNIDKNQAFDCGSATDMEMMEKGEDMMEQMMGHDDHEKMEEAMNAEDHDSMHMMMGMWSTGCVGDETMNTLATHYGFVNNGMTGPGMMQGWGNGGYGLITSILVWIILGLAIVGLWRWIKSSSKPGTPTTPAV